MPTPARFVLRLFCFPLGIPVRIHALRFACSKPDLFRFGCPDPDIRIFPGRFQRAWRVGDQGSQVEPDIRDGNRGRFLGLRPSLKFVSLRVGFSRGHLCLKPAYHCIDPMPIVAVKRSPGAGFYLKPCKIGLLRQTGTFGPVIAFRLALPGSCVFFSKP